MENKKNKKVWTIGRGIGIGLVALSIALVIIFAFIFIEHQINIFKYERCIEKQEYIDVCIPIINDNYYPRERAIKPAPIEIIEDE